MKLLHNRRLQRIILSILSGMLLAFSFPPFKTWFFVYFGLIILIHLLLDSEKFRQAFASGYLTLLIFNAITLYWISGWHSNDTFLKIGGVATVFVHSLFMMIPVLITYGISRYKKLIALVLFPLIWVGYEYFDNVWQFAFPWLELGNTETYNLNRVQYAELVGVHGISFVILTASCLLYFIIRQIALKKWGIISSKATISFTILLILILFPNFYSYYRLSQDNSRYFNTPDSTKAVDIAIVQANTDPFVKWKKEGEENLLESYLRLLNESRKFNPDIFVLHETATPFYFLEDYNLYKSQKFINFAETNSRYLLMGIPHLELYNDSINAPPDARRKLPSGKLYDTYNSAILLEPGKNRSDYTIHKKIKLVPFSERVPYQEKFTFLKEWIKWGVGISGWQRGSERTIFNADNGRIGINTKFAALICYESVFSELVTEFTQKGAEFFIIVTNDGWWGNNAGPVQHEQYAVLRAVENRKWIARCAQTGVSCFIDPLGNSYDRIPYWNEGIINRKIIANTEKTFFTKHGDIIGKAGFYTGIICFAGCFVIYAYNKKLKSKA